ITSAQVVDVFIGTGWSTDTGLTQMRQYIDSCNADMVSSDFMTQMAEYTYNVGFGSPTPIGKGRFVGSVAMNAAASRPVTDFDIQSYLTDQINSGHIPYPANSNDYVYMVYLAPGIQSQTCIDKQFAAYHDHFNLPTGQSDHGLQVVIPVAYAIMPSPVD